MGLGLHLGLQGKRVGAAGPFTPINLGANLVEWWTADRADLITLSGAQVTDWFGVVGNRDLSQAVSGARPLYSATSFNGSPGVTFDGVDDEVAIVSVPGPIGSSGGELWLLADNTALPADTSARIGLAYGSGSSANNRRGLGRSVVTGVNVAQVRTGNGTTTLVDALGDFSGRHVLRGVITPTTSTVYLDGVAGPGVAAVPSTSSSTGRTRIGGNSGSAASAFFQGVVRDALITLPLTTQQASDLTTYLMNKRNP